MERWQPEYALHAHIGMAQWSVCPQEEGVMPLVAQPSIPGWRTLAPLSGTHSLQGMRKAFLATMGHGRWRNSGGRLEEFATVQALLAKREDCQVDLFVANCWERTNALCTRGWGGV